ncbi:MobV family relaxase (plasmid) [Oscillospiraceae bacterium PP1C4]
MSYAIIRTAKHKMANLPSISRHNERKNEHYGNKDIDTSKSDQNYYFVEPQANSYEKEFERIRQEQNLKGNIRKTGNKQSTVVCEFMMTSDRAFFDSIGPERTKEYFKDCFDFVKQKCGEKNVISAVVHMDETSPHMHVSFIPVVKDKDRKGNDCNRINCSKFWKGYNSYGKLQDGFHAHCITKGYDLERGEIGSRTEHLSVAEFKEKTLNKKVQELSQKQNELKKEVKALQGNLQHVKAVDSIPIKKSLTGANVTISTEHFENLQKVAKHSISLATENKKLRTENSDLKQTTDSVMQLRIENGKLKGEINRLEKEIDMVNQSLDKLPPLEKSNFLDKYIEVKHGKSIAKPPIDLSQHR